MKTLWILPLLALGCGDEPERRNDQLLAGWQGPPPHVNVVVTGPDADNDKRERCGRIAQRAGMVVDPMAPVQATLELADNRNRLVVVSRTRGMLRAEPRPGWDMEHLCNDALMAIVSALQQEQSAPPPPAYNAPPPVPGAPPPAYGAPPPGPGGVRIGIALAGPDANPDKQQRCQRVIQERMGFIPDPSAPVTAVLTLRDGHNQLQVISRARGPVRVEARPGWGMERLCLDAAQAAIAVAQQEGAGAPPPGYTPAPFAAPNTPPPAAPPAAAPRVSLLPASPGAPKNVAELAQRGQADFARGDYGNALVAFAEANRMSGDPAMLFDTGVCYSMLNRPQEALQHLQLYVDRAPQAPNRAQAEALIAHLHRQMGEEE
jgi:hypothetical protein